MKKVHSTGDTVSLEFKIGPTDVASFNGEDVHPFYATFALGRDVEWTCRQFVLNEKEADEEGIGTFLNIKHQSPAMLHDTVVIEAQIIQYEGNSLDCAYTVKVGNRIVASGEQGQKILKKEKVERLIAAVQNNEKAR
jgi:predicted thioesterase